jgi:ribosomal protein L10
VDISLNIIPILGIALRGKAVVLMGKNTMVRRAIKGFIQEGSMSDIERILPSVKGKYLVTFFG